MLNTLAQSLRARLFTAAAVGLSIAVVIGGVAVAITSGDFTYSPARAGYFTINALAMSPDGSGGATGYSIEFASQSLRRNNGLSGCFVTGVNLPNGARISNLAWWYSSGPGGEPSFILFRHALGNGAVTNIAARFVGSDTGARTLDYSAIPQSANTIVDNAKASYSVGLCLGPNDRFSGARIGYGFNSAGD